MKAINLVPSGTDAAADRTTVAYELGDLTDYSISVDFTGANVVGTLTLEASNSATSGFVTVSGSSQAVTASADHLWSVTGAGYRYVRVVWDYTSGTGNMTVDLVAKEMRVVGA